MSERARTAIAAMALSAAGLIALVSHEGFRDKAYVPVPGDRPTVGFGSTFNPDGTPVKMGDTAAPQKALRMSLAHIGRDEHLRAGCQAHTFQEWRNKTEREVLAMDGKAALVFYKETLIPLMDALKLGV